MKTLLNAPGKTAFGIFVMLSAAFANAAVFTPLNIEFSGGVPPASATLPWVTGSFDNEAGGTVLFTLAGAKLTNPEKLTSFYFNFNDSLRVQDLNFQLVSGGAFTAPTINRSRDAYQADGDGKYDIRLDFANNGGTSQEFGQGDTLTYRLTYTSAIDASQFGYRSLPSGGHGPFYAAAHVQNTPGGQSGWIGATAFVPVPEASPLLASGPLVVIACVTALCRGRRWFVARG